MEDGRSKLLTLVKQEFAGRKARNSAYSMRSFAKSLGVHSSALSEILNGKRIPSQKMASKILDHLAIEEESQHSLLQELDRKRSDSERYSALDLDTFTAISEWHYLAIVNLFQVSGFSENAGAIAKRLALPEEVVIHAIDKLLGIGLLEHDGTALKATQKNISIGNELMNKAIQASHKENLRLADAALEETPVDERQFAIMNIAAHSSDLQF